MTDKSQSQEIDERIAALGDWRGETLGRLRVLIKKADPEVVEEVKWRKPSNAMSGVPVWSTRRHPVHRRDVPGQGQADLRQGRVARRSRRDCSIRASRAAHGARSTFVTATRWMKKHSRR